MLLLLLPDVVEVVELAEEALLRLEAVELIEELLLESEVVELVEEILLIEETPELVDVILLGTPADEELVDVTILPAGSIALVEFKEPVLLIRICPELLVLVSTVARPVMFEALKLVEIVSFALGPVARYSMTVTAEPEDGNTVENEMVEPE